MATAKKATPDTEGKTAPKKRAPRKKKVVEAPEPVVETPTVEEAPEGRRRSYPWEKEPEPVVEPENGDVARAEDEGLPLAPPTRARYIKNLTHVDGKPLAGPPFLPSTADVPPPPSPIAGDPENVPVESVDREPVPVTPVAPEEEEVP